MRLFPATSQWSNVVGAMSTSKKLIIDGDDICIALETSSLDVQGVSSSAFISFSACTG